MNLVTSISFELYFTIVESGLYEVSMKRSINGIENNSYILPEYQLTFKGLCQIIEESRADCVIIIGEKSASLLAIYSILKEQFPHLEFQMKYQSSNVKLSDEAFFNGFNLLLSGLYPSNLYHVGTKHLVRMGQSQEEYSKTKRMHQSINSSLISDGLNNEDNDIYYLKKILFKELDNDTKQRKKIYNLSMANSKFNGKKVHAVNFSDRSTIEINKTDDIHVIYFDSEDDIEEYDQFVSKVNEKGILPALECFYLIKDECMWATETFCSLENNIRGKLPGDGSFISQSSCYNKSEDNKFSGGSFQCMVFNSDSIKNQLFQKVKRENDFLESYTKYRNILRSFVMKIDLRDLTEPILFNTPKKTHLSKIDVLENSYIDRNYFIFHFKSETYLYNKDQQKFYLISKKMAIILEVFMYTNNKLEADKIINNHFSMTDAKLRTIIKGFKEQFHLII